MSSPTAPEGSPATRGTEVSAHVRLRAPPQPGVTDATKMRAEATATRYSAPAAPPPVAPRAEARPVHLSGVPRPRRSLEHGAVRLASTRLDHAPCKSLRAGDSLAGSVSVDATWHSRGHAPGACVKNAADMLPRRSRVTSLIVAGPQRSSAMGKLVASDASLASTARVAAPPRPISSTRTTTSLLH